MEEDVCTHVNANPFTKKLHAADVDNNMSIVVTDLLQL